MNYEENSVDAQVEEQSNDLFGIEENQPTVNTEEDESYDMNSEQLTEENEEDLSPKEKQARAYQKLQSEKDKLANEYAQIRSQFEELQAYTPIVKYLEANPQVIENLEKSVIGGNAEGEQPQAEPELQKPEKPVRPSNFSRFDAEEDPESESAKYLESLDNYREQMDEYYEKKREMTLTKEEQRLKQQIEAQQQKQQLTQLAQELTTNHGLKGEEVKEFVSMMNNPNPSISDLVALYKLKKGQTNMSKEEVNNKANVLRKRQQQQRGGTPPIGGATQPPIDEAQSFMNGLAQRDLGHLFETK